MKRIYLDHAATTPTDPEVVKAMLPYFADAFGNPSSIHSFGQETKAAVEEARDNIASLIGAKSEEIAPPAAWSRPMSCLPWGYPRSCPLARCELP